MMKVKKPYSTHGLLKVLIEVIASRKKGDIITADDLWDRIGNDAVLESPNGSMGPVFSMAQRRGYIKALDRAPVKSKHPGRKGGGIRQWRIVKVA